MSKIIAVIFMILFIAFPEAIKEGAKEGIENGIFVLIPSIFPYMVISNIFIKTGASEFISNIFYKILRPVFRYTKNFSSFYLISLFCGYPTGARMSAVYEEKNKRESLRLFSFGNVPGFGFCVSFLGFISGNIKTGIAIYLCFLCSSIILNYIFSFFLFDNEIIRPQKTEFENIAVSVTQSVKEAVLSIINVIGYAVFFSSISSLINNKYIGAFLEITSGVPKLKNIYEIVFFTGFSGLSVIFQSLSFKKSPVPLLFVLFARFLFALTSVLLFFILKKSGF